jgi:hypothetical protein
VCEASAEPIQLPTDDDIDLAVFGICLQSVENGSPVLRARDACLDVFRGLPATSLAVSTKLHKLILAGLIRG